MILFIWVLDFFVYFCTVKEKVFNSNNREFRLIATEELTKKILKKMDSIGCRTRTNAISMALSEWVKEK